jgi:hypothetical protein
MIRVSPAVADANNYQGGVVFAMGMGNPDAGEQLSSFGTAQLTCP